MYPAVLMLQPEIAASLMKYRFDRIPAAQSKAAGYTSGPNHGLKGAMFPWQSAMTGVECTPAFAGYGRDREIHISGDIALAAWNYYTHGPSNDLAWLRSVGFPLIHGVCDFYMSKLALDNPGADPTQPLFMYHVVGPDEYHTDTNNSAYNSAVAVLTLRAGATAAKLLSQPETLYAPWVDAAARLVVPYNASVAGYTSGGLRPEYTGYVLGTKVKQADTILLGFPLGFTNNDTSGALTANDLDYYGQHTDPNGPAMTWAMFAVGYIGLGQAYEAKAAVMYNKSFANVHPPFGIWMETPTGGTPNFLTGAGGFVQLGLSGYPGLRVNDSAMTLTPRLPSSWASIKLRGIAYKGHRLDIFYTAEGVTITMLTGSSTVAAAPLQLVDEVTGKRQALAPGQAVFLPAPLKSFAVVEAGGREVAI